MVQECFISTKEAALLAHSSPQAGGPSQQVGRFPAIASYQVDIKTFSMMPMLVQQWFFQNAEVESKASPSTVVSNGNAGLWSSRPPWVCLSDTVRLDLQALVLTLVWAKTGQLKLISAQGEKNNRVRLRDSGHCSGEGCRFRCQLVCVLMWMLPVYPWAIYLNSLCLPPHIWKMGC